MQFISDRFQGVWAPPYLKKFAFKVAMVLLVIGGINWLCVGLFDTNVVESIVGNGFLASLIYMLVGISAIAIMFDRDTYLPFLGPTLAPCSVLQDRVPPGATKDVKVVVVPNTKVIYWAAESDNDKLKEMKSWKEAYAKYDNAGVTTSNSDGIAILKVREPQSYKVPFKGKLDPHVHYRVCGESGFMEKVNTVSMNKSEPEGFESEQMDKYSKGRNLADSSASIY